MSFRTRRLPRVLVPVLAVALVALGAGSATASTAKKLKTATLNGSGSTLQAAFDQECIAAFTAKESNVTINYGGGGSGKGRQDLADEVTDFAGSDSPFSADELADVKGGDVLYFPTILSPITVSYNVEGVKNLKLSGKTISKIFQRTITKWNDDAIAAENPKADLPSTEITVVHRSDSSGTTANFVTFLAKADPSGWKLGVGSTVTWPSDTTGGEGNTGVAEAIAATDGAIGYVDFSDAKAAGLAFAAVKNQLGNYVKPSTKAASEAAATVAINDDLTYDPTFATGETSYPITAATWIIVYKTQDNPAKGAAIKAFLKFVLTKGQKIAPKVDYAPVSEDLAQRALAQIDEIEA